MSISYKKITPFDSAFGLVRTNPKLTGNVKLVINSNHNLFLESISANPELAKDQYKAVHVDPNSSHESNLYTFFNNGLTPENIVFDVKHEVSIKNTSSNFEDQYDFSEYFGGARYCVSKNYTERLRYFAPLYLNKNLPEKFVIIKIPGASHLPIIDTKSAYPYDKNSHIEDILSNSIIIKTFDLGAESNIGKYIRRYQSRPLYPKKAMTYVFENSKLGSYSGIAYKVGSFSEKFENLQDLHIGGKILSEFEDYVTGGYERNGLIYPFILNLEFLFDDTTDDYEFSRYFGIYCNTIDLENLNFDLINHAALNINSPRIINAAAYDHAQLPFTQKNSDGLILKFDSVSEDTKDALANLDNLGIITIEDKDKNLHKISEVIPDAGEIRVSTQALDLSLLHGPTELFLEDTGEVASSGLKSFIELKITDIPNHLDKIRVFFPNGKDINQNINKFETICAIKNITFGGIDQVDTISGTPASGPIASVTDIAQTVSSGQGLGATFKIKRTPSQYQIEQIIQSGYEYSVGDFVEIDGASLFSGTTPENNLSFRVSQIIKPSTIELIPGDYYSIYNNYAPDQFYFSIDTDQVDSLDAKLEQIAKSLTGAINSIKNSGFKAFNYKNRIFIIVETDGDFSSSYGIQYIPSKEEVKIEVSDSKQTSTRVDYLVSEGESIQLDFRSVDYIVFGEAAPTVNNITYATGSLISGTGLAKIEFGLGNYDQTYLVSCPLVRFETGAKLKTHISINSEYQQKLHDNAGEILIQSKDGWATVYNVVRSIDKITEESFTSEAGKAEAVKYYDSHINVITEPGTEAVIKFNLFHIKRKFKPAVKILSFLPVKDFDFDRVESQYAGTPVSDLWKTLHVPEGINLINLHKSSYRVYNGTIQIGSTKYSTGDIIEKSHISGIIAASVQGSKILNIPTINENIIIGSQIIDSTGAIPNLTTVKEIAINSQQTGLVITMSNEATATSTLSNLTFTPAAYGQAVSYSKVTGDPIVIPCLSEIEPIITLDVELGEVAPDILDFKGFFTITASHAQRPVEKTEAYIYRDKFNNGVLDSEYDANYERYMLNLESKNRLVKYICKWGADGSLDARSNPYRLNADLAFGANNFSPDSTKFEPDPNLLTHEWFYIESLHDYVNDIKASSQNKIYFDKPFIIESAISQPSYFDDYFIYTPSYTKRSTAAYSDSPVSINNPNIQPNTAEPVPTARTQYRFSNIKKDELSGIAKTIFKGVKYTFKEVDLKSNERELTGALKYIRNSDRFTDYKFSIILKTIETEAFSTDKPISFNFIESIDNKFIVLVIELRLIGKDLNLTSANGINSLFTTKNKFTEGSGEDHIINHITESFADYRINFDVSKVSDITLAYLYYSKNKKYNTLLNSFSSINLVNSLDLSSLQAYGNNLYVASLDGGAGITITDEIVKPLANSVFAFNESGTVKLLGSSIITPISAEFPVSIDSYSYNFSNLDFTGGRYITSIVIDSSTVTYNTTPPSNKIFNFVQLKDWFNANLPDGSVISDGVGNISISSTSVYGIIKFDNFGSTGDTYNSILDSNSTGQYFNLNLNEFSSQVQGITSIEANTITEEILGIGSDKKLSLYNFFKNGALAINSQKSGEIIQPLVSHSNITVVSGESTITLASSISDVKIGAGVDIPNWTTSDTTVQAINGQVITLNKPLKSSISNSKQPLDITNGSSLAYLQTGVNLDIENLIAVGDTVYVSGTGIPSGTTVTSIDNANISPDTGLTLPKITLSAPATSDLDTVATFFTKSTNVTSYFFSAEISNNIGISSGVATVLPSTTNVNYIDISELKNTSTGQPTTVNPNTEVLLSQVNTKFSSITYPYDSTFKILRVLNPQLQTLFTESGIAQVLSTGVTFTYIPCVALPEFIDIPRVSEDSNIKFEFDSIIRRTQTLPLYTRDYWQRLPFAMLLGGAEHYTGLFKRLSLAAFKKAILQGAANVTYTTYRNGVKSNNEFYLEIEEPAVIEKLKIPTVTQVKIEQAQERVSSGKETSNVVGYLASESFLQSPIFILRHSSDYSPIFREVSAFIPQTTISAGLGSIYNANCQLNPSANRFFDVKGFEHIKVSNTKILDYEGNDKYTPVFTLIDETPISTADLYLMASDWDFGFHKYYINKKDYIDTYGTRRIGEDSYFMSKLAALPNIIEIDSISASPVDQLPPAGQETPARSADILYVVNKDTAELDINLTSSILAKILDSTSITDFDFNTTASFSPDSYVIQIASASSKIKTGMVVKGAGLQDFSLVSAVNGTQVTISRKPISAGDGSIKVRFTPKAGLYYQILDSFGINQDTLYPELLGPYDFTTYVKQYAIKNIIPNYSIDEVTIWYTEQKELTPGLTINQLTADERYALGYKKLEGAQINIKKGIVTQLKIPLKKTGSLSVNIETKMRFI